MPELDGLRGLAALAVLAFHGWFLCNWPPTAEQPLWQALHGVLALGWSGVDLFFTLSAFLLSLPFVRRPAALQAHRAPALRHYYGRRALRILPAYWAQVLLLALLSPAVEVSADGLLVQLALLFNVGATPQLPWLPVWWTLPVEFGFYLLLPLLALLLRPGRWPWLLLCVAASWAYRSVVLDADVPRLLQIAWADHLPGRLDQFVLGMLGAYAWVAGGVAERLADRRVLASCAGLGLAAWAAVHAWPLLLGSAAGPGPSTEPWLLGWHGLASIALLPTLWACASGGSRLLGWLGSDPWRAVGRISFGLYLWHVPVMLLARPWAMQLLPESPWRPLLFIVAVLPACLLLAWLSWCWIEQPALARADRRRALVPAT